MSGFSSHFPDLTFQRQAQSIGLMTRSDVADRLGLSGATMNKLWREGRGPRRTLINGKWYVQPKHLVEWLDACTIGDGDAA